MILTEQDIKNIIFQVINEIGGKFYGANKVISDIAYLNNRIVGSGIVRSGGRFTSWQNIIDKMAELNPQIRNSMVQTYAKNPFHFYDENESGINISIELRVFDVININRNNATLLCQRIQHGDTKTIRLKITFANNYIYYQTYKGRRNLRVDQRYSNEWNNFYNQLTIVASML